MTWSDLHLRDAENDLQGSEEAQGQGGGGRGDIGGALPDSFKGEQLCIAGGWHAISQDRAVKDVGAHICSLSG